MRDDLANVGPWSAPSRYSQTGVHHGYRRVVMVSAGVRQTSHLPDLLDSLEPISEAWLSWIDPGGFIVPHVDAGPHLERWQVPLQPAGIFDGPDTTPTEGVPMRVHQWEPHAVWNTGDRARIHLVVDRDVIAHQSTNPFQTFPVPPERAGMVERSLHG